MPPAEPGRRPGLSIVTALRDRAATLNASLPSWLSLGALVDEIVVVDCGGAPGLAALGVLAVPRLVLVTLEDDRRQVPFGLARNVGAQVARGDTLLVLDPDLALGDASASILRSMRAGGFATAPPPAGLAPIPGAVLVARDAFARAGGYHEFLPGAAFTHEDLAIRLDDGETPRRFLDPDTLGRAPRTEPARIARAPAPDGIAWPDGLERTPLFEARRNRILAALVPWTASLASLRPRRIGMVADRHHACALAPRSPFEQRQRDAASYLAARVLHDADPDREIGAALVASLIGDPDADEERAARLDRDARRQFQLDRLAGDRTPKEPRG